MSAYTVNEDNLFFDEKTIVCLQKLDRIYQLRLMTLYVLVNNCFLTFMNVKIKKKIGAAGDKINLEIFMTYT